MTHKLKLMRLGRSAGKVTSPFVSTGAVGARATAAKFNNKSVDS